MSKVQHVWQLRWDWAVGHFYILPTINVSWGECGCWGSCFMVGNIRFGLVRYCYEVTVVEIEEQNAQD